MSAIAMKSSYDNPFYDPEYERIFLGEYTVFIHFNSFVYDEFLACGTLNPL
jgi:hypothetical protein